MLRHSIDDPKMTFRPEQFDIYNPAYQPAPESKLDVINKKLLENIMYKGELDKNKLKIKMLKQKLKMTKQMMCMKERFKSMQHSSL